LASRLAKEYNAEVISVNYSLSPEAAPRVALNEGYEVWKTASPGRKVLLLGDSAGGNLAAGLTLMIMEKHSKEEWPIGTILFYPVLDLTRNYRRFRCGYGLDSELMSAFIKAYVQDETLRNFPLFSPIYGDLKGFPPTLVIASQFDMLRDEAREFSDKLCQNGVSVIYHVMEGVLHGFITKEQGWEDAQDRAYELVKDFLHKLGL
jgi:acetyl esterase